MKPGWSTARWREHPLGIEGASSIGIVVGDMAKAKRLYCDVLNGELLHEESIAGRKHSASVAIGEDSVAELAEPLDADSVEGRELARKGEGIYSLVLKTNSLERARAFLQAKAIVLKRKAPTRSCLAPIRRSACGSALRSAHCRTIRAIGVQSLIVSR